MASPENPDKDADSDETDTLSPFRRLTKGLFGVPRDEYERRLRAEKEAKPSPRPKAQ